MGLFDFLFKRTPRPEGGFQGEVRLLNGYEPYFRRWGGDIYESELVRASINAIATHISKLDVSFTGTARPALVGKLKHGPNAFQTWSQFLYRLATILYIHNTAFILPVYGEAGDMTGVYAALPDRCAIVQYGGKPYLRYTFSGGETAAVELELCGVLTRYQYKNDFTGESNAALRPTMELITMQNEGIQEGVRSSATYRFMATMGNFVKPEDLAKERQRFSELNLSKDAKGGGLLLFPNTYSNVKQIESKPYVPDADTMKLINTSVFEYFGVNEDILQNKAYGDAWAAFYEGVVEPFAIQLGTVMERMLFSFREQSAGNRVVISANRLQYMTNKDKLSVSSEMLDRGVMSINEIREIWQLPPVEGGDVRVIRGEYYSADEKVGEEGESNEPA